MKGASLPTGNVSVLNGLQHPFSLNRHAVMASEQLSDQDRYRVQPTGPSGLRGLIPSSLVVQPQDLNPVRHHSLSPTKAGRVIRASAIPRSPSLVGKPQNLNPARHNNAVRHHSLSPTKASKVTKSSVIPSSLAVKPQDLNPARHHSLSPTKVGKVKAFDETLYSPFSRSVLKGQYAQLAFNGDVLGNGKNLPDQERDSLLQEISVMPVALADRPQNVISTTREPKQTERRSLLQSGRRDSRSKLTARKPDLLRASSMSNVMASAGKQTGQQTLSKDIQRPNLMSTPEKTRTSQRSLHGASERTSKSDSEILKRRSNNERASSVRDVMASTGNQKSRRALSIEKKQTSERTLMNASRQPSVDDAQTPPKQLVKPGTRVRLQGLNATPALNGQAVTIAKFLSDDKSNRVKPLSVEAADATSTKAVSSLPVLKRIVPTTTHATRRPVMAPKASSQRSVVQRRKSDSFSGNVTPTPTAPTRTLSSNAKIPAHQKSASECFSVVVTLCPYTLEDEFPGVSM
jgi:hypothetical protein